MSETLGIITLFLFIFVQALKTAHAGISLSEAEASIASPFTSKVLITDTHRLKNVVEYKIKNDTTIPV